MVALPLDITPKIHRERQSRNVPRLFMFSPLDRLKYLNTGFPVDGIVWGARAGLLEEVHHRGWTLRAHSFTPLPGHNSPFLFAVEDVISRIPAAAAMPAASLLSSLSHP